MVEEANGEAHVSAQQPSPGEEARLPIEDADSLIDFETAKPEPKGRDIRVAVKAISANPVDYKVRKRAAPPAGGIATTCGRSAVAVVGYRGTRGARSPGARWRLTYPVLNVLKCARHREMTINAGFP